ncbi:hypothetical protein PMAYCL1PPCAC_18167 [Pristionchus mayeri]|uniref:Uncharacterized protein n=1 Tax=Pristionchus mayeri TaxID=1317129 RepID=A0AAN5CP33_9BILA|nr:hypothetical protein PMAYCL1PPCAC_18167 [Pristionchus mayeri]
MEGSLDESFPDSLVKIRGNEISFGPRIVGDNSVWDTYDCLKKKRGRKRVTEIMHISNPRLNTALECRGHNNEMSGASLRSVFVDDDGSDMHFDWPIYLKDTIRECDAAMVIISNGSSVPVDRICSTPPQEFTETGVFILDVRPLNSYSCPLSDGLGLWGVPHTTCTFYSSNVERVNEASVNWGTKVVCERYKHPGTSHCGNFNKFVYSGVSRSGESYPLIVLSYEWEGQPHAISVQDSVKFLDVTSGLSWGTFPMYSHSPADFDTVSRILLGSFLVDSDRICEALPDSFCGTGTFLVNIDKAGGEKILHTAGGGKWTKPSGASRFFRADAESGHWIRVDKGRGEEGEEWDVQIISKRYESESHAGLSRKIFLVREKRDDVETAHSSLAVITFSWKDVKGGTQIHSKQRGSLRRKRNTLNFEASVDSLSYSELRQLTIRKESQNYERFGALLTRFETIANRYEEIMQVSGEGVGMEREDMEREEGGWMNKQEKRK